MFVVTLSTVSMQPKNPKYDGLIGLKSLCVNTSVKSSHLHIVLYRTGLQFQSCFTVINKKITKSKTQTLSKMRQINILLYSSSDSFHVIPVIFMRLALSNVA